MVLQFAIPVGGYALVADNIEPEHRAKAMASLGAAIIARVLAWWALAVGLLLLLVLLMLLVILLRWRSVVLALGRRGGVVPLGRGRVVAVTGGRLGVVALLLEERKLGDGDWMMG